MFFHSRSSDACGSRRVMNQEQGTLTYNEFCYFGKLFASIAELNNDTWVVHGSEETEGTMYLVKKIQPHEVHEPHLCLRGLAFHQQHGGLNRADTVRNMIRSVIELLNDRDGPIPKHTTSMMELTSSQSHLKDDLERRHSLSSMTEDKETFDSMSKPSTFHPEWCACHKRRNNDFGSSKEYSTRSNSAANPDSCPNCFFGQIPQLDTLLKGTAPELVLPDDVGSDDIIGPPPVASSTSQSQSCEISVNNSVQDLISLHDQSTTKFYEQLGEVADGLFSNKFYQAKPSVPTDETDTFYSMDSSEDEYFSNAETDRERMNEKEIDELSFSSSLVYCDSLSQDPASFEFSSATNEKDLFWEFHIIYSVSYCVPVLFFQVWDHDGKIVPLWKLWGIVDTKFQGRLRHDRWSILTQQEHPFLRRPFYFLHPCGTQSLLKILKPSWNPIVSWLMSIGPTVGLNLCPLYGQPRYVPQMYKRKKTKMAIN